MDPLAASTARFSPYTGMNDNPVITVDPLGLQGQSNTGSQFASGLMGLIWAVNTRPSEFSGGGDIFALLKAFDREFGEWKAQFEKEREKNLAAWSAMLGGGSITVTGTAIIVTNDANASSDGGNSPTDIVALFTGADMGQGATPSTEQIADDLQGGNRFVEVFKSNYYLDDDQNTAQALGFVMNLKKDNPDGRVLIYGYSYGGVLANRLAERLDKEGIAVTYMAIVDATNGFTNNVNRTVGKNVGYTDNFYQSTFKRPDLHGGAYSGMGTINNYPMRGVDHMSIDDATRNAITNMMRAFLRR